MGGRFGRYILGFILVLFTTVGGLTALWQLAELVGNNVSVVVVPAPAGVPLQGSYSLNRLVVTGVFVLLILTFYLAFELWRAVRAASPNVGEVKMLRAMYDDMVHRARNITENIFPDKSDRRCIDILDVTERVAIERTGDASVLRKYKIKCTTRPAYILEVWVDLDDETPELFGFHGLGLAARDLTRGNNLDWIPTIDGRRNKRVTLFLSEMAPGEEREIEVSFQCPGYVNRLLEKGLMEYFWAYQSATNGSSATVRFDWLFGKGFPATSAAVRGVHPTSAKLRMKRLGGEGFQWTYRASNLVTDKRNYSIVFRLEAP
jgi:hypothetical protein